MSEKKPVNIPRGIFVAACSTLIISFMVLILGPVLPFIKFDSFIALFLVIFVFFLSIRTYFVLPAELPEEEEPENLSSQ